MGKKITAVSGRRKTAVAKVRVFEGSGKITYNLLPYEKLGMFQRLAILEPIKLAEGVLGGIKFDIDVKTSGGGKEAQIEAARLGIAKGLVKFTNSVDLKRIYLDYDRNLLVADTRQKETCKPGDSKARAKRQSSKR